MPGLIGVSEFVDETREDYNSPTTSTFVSRMPQCRQTIVGLEEVSNFFFVILNNLDEKITSFYLTYFCFVYGFYSCFCCLFLVKM